MQTLAPNAEMKQQRDFNSNQDKQQPLSHIPKSMKKYFRIGMIAFLSTLPVGYAVAKDDCPETTKGMSRERIEECLKVNWKAPPELSKFYMCSTDARYIPNVISRFRDGVEETEKHAQEKAKCTANLLQARIYFKVQYLEENGLLTDELKSGWERVKSSTDLRIVDAFDENLDSAINNSEKVEELNNSADDSYERNNHLSSTAA